MRAIALALAMIWTSAMAQTAQDESQIEEMWAKFGSDFSSAGISRPMYRQYHYWVTGQFILGNCAPHLREEDLLHWRSWWKGTPLESSDIGRQMLLTANDLYNAGVEERLSRPLPRAQCISAAVKWGQEMKRVTQGSP